MSISEPEGSFTTPLTAKRPAEGKTTAKHSHTPISVVNILDELADRAEK